MNKIFNASILLILSLVTFGCTIEHHQTFIKAPVLYGQAAKGSAARSLVVGYSNNPNQTLDGSTVVPFSLQPVVTAWASSPISGGSLSYNLFGQPVDVRVTNNSDGSTIFAGTINGSGSQDDHNTSAFTITLNADNTFNFEQAIWLRLNTDPNNSSVLYNTYIHTTGHGKVTNTAGDFTIDTGSEYKADGFGSTAVFIHNISFVAKTQAGNIALLTTQDYYHQVTDPGLEQGQQVTLGTGGSATNFETNNVAPTASTPGVQSEQVFGWYFVSDNGIFTYIKSPTGLNQSGDVLGWGVYTVNLDTNPGDVTAANAYGQTF